MSEREVVIYHNPRCSKSRQALGLIEDCGITPTVVQYLVDPPAAETVRSLLKALAIEPHDLLRTKEEPYRELGLSAQSSADEVAEAIAAHPILLERPVVVVGDRAVIGRPPERVAELLS